MGNEYSADLSGLRDELISGLRQLRKEVQQEGKKITEAVEDIAKDVDLEPIEIAVDTKGAKKELQALDKQLKSFTKKIKNNLSSLSTSDMREVLSIISKLKDTKEYGEQIQEVFGNITASFIGVGEVIGLQDVVEEFENAATALRNIDWGFGKLHDKNKLIEDQKEIIDQLKQIGKLSAVSVRTKSGDFSAGKINIFDGDFAVDELETRIALLESLRDNVNELAVLTKAKKITLFDDSIYHPENIVFAIGRAISSARAQFPAIDEYDVPDPEDIFKQFEGHVGGIIDRKEMSKRLQDDFEFYREAILNGRYTVEDAINSFAKDIEVDKMHTAWEEMIDGIDVPQRLLSMPEEYSVQIRAGVLELNDAISYMRGAIDGLQTEIVPDDLDDLDDLFESENLRYYNDLIEECTNLTGELSDAVVKHAKIQRAMVDAMRSGYDIPDGLKDARDKIEEVISGYFKKDFSEPLLSTDGILMWLQSSEAEAQTINELVGDIEAKYQHMLAIQSAHDERAEAVEKEREATVEILGIRNEIQRITRNASKYKSESLKSEVEYFSSALRNLNKQKDKLAEFKALHDGENFNDIIDETHSKYKQSVQMLIGNIAERVSGSSAEKYIGDVKSFNLLPKEQLNLIKKRAEAITDVNNQLYERLNELGVKNPRTEIPEFLPVYDEVLGGLKSGAIGATDAIEQLRSSLESLNKIRVDKINAAQQSVSQVDESVRKQQQLSPLEEFDSYKGDGFYGMEIEKFGQEAVDKFQAILKNTREELSQGRINLEQAWSKLVNETSAAMHGMQSDIEDTAKTVRTLSAEQHAKMFDGASIKPLLDSYHIGKDEQNEIYDEFHNLGNMIASKMDIDDIEEQKSNIISLVLKSAKNEVETGLESFFQELTSGKIYYDSKEIGEIGKNTFADIKSALSSYRLLTPNREKGIRADEYFHGLSDYVQGVIKNAFEREYGFGFNGSKSNILQGIAAVIKNAPSKFAGLSDDEQDDVRIRTAGIVDKVISNVENLLQTEQKVTEEVIKQNKARQGGAKVSDVEETIEPILKIAEESARMIELISSAAGKDAATKFLEGITSETDLQDRISKYFNTVFNSDDWKFKEGQDSIIVVGDMLKAKLVNSVEDTLSAVFRLKDGMMEVQKDTIRFGKANIEPFDVSKSIEDATAKIEKLKLELGDSSYAGMSKLEESFKAITDEKSFRAFNEQLKVSQKEVKKIADDTKWIIEQNKQLDSKVRSYKYGSKQLNGATTKLEDPDSTSMEDGANKTIDGLADHIRNRLKNVAAGTLTDAIKNIIRDDMRILENEIKVGQLEKYTSTTMSASEAEAARKALINQLDTLKAQAEKGNVFDVIAESYDKLRSRLTDDQNAEYITTNFSDAINGIRVIRSVKDKAIAESGVAKQEQQYLENTLKIQDKLYESRKKLVSLQLDETISDSDLQAAERKTNAIEQQYDASLRLLKTAEDYNTAKQRELQLEDELKTVMFEQYKAQAQRAEDAEEKNIAAETKRDISRYDQEQNMLQKARLEIQKEQAEEQRKQKENQEELISLQKLYNEADYKWHQADIDGGDKSPYNEQMESYIRRMQELRKETKLTAEQQVELNKINNDHQVKKNKLLDAVAAADSKSLSDLQTFSRWESDIKNVGMISDETAQRIERMRSAIDGISDNTDIQKLAEDFKTLKSDVKYETTQSKATKTRMSEIKASLNAQKQELKALYGELNLELPIGDRAPSAQDIQDSYLNAISAIEKCTSAIGEQTQEEIASATASANAAKIKINAYKEVQDQLEAEMAAEEQRTGDSAIKQYYQELNSTIQQIANLDTKINNLKLKDDGSGTWTPIIDSLDMQREQLLEKVRETVYKINDAFNAGFVQGDNKIELPFSSILSSLKDDDASQIIQDFFNDFRVQESLTEQSIASFVSNIQNAQNKAEEFATVLAEKLSVVSKSAKILSDLGRTGAMSTDHELYKGGLDRLVNFDQYKTTLPSDPTTWSAEQTITILKLANDVNEYVSALDKAASKEAEYFASKKQYANIANMQDYTEMASSMYRMSDNATDARTKLESFVDSFADGRAIITGFTTSADGISRIDFSVLEEGTGYLRNFTAEMGQFTSNVYTVESTMNNMTAGTKAAQKTLSSMSQAMSRLNDYGMTADNNEFVKDLYVKMQTLGDVQSRLGSSKDAGDQRTLLNMANDADRLLQKILALEKAYLKMNDAVADGDAQKVGNIGSGENVYEKMVQFANEVATTMPGCTLEIGKFNEKTKQLPYVIETADGEIKTFIMTMEKLGGVVVSEFKNIDKAKTGWEELGSSFGGLGKEILKYGATLVGVHDFVRYLKQGFNEVLEIDTAMTELKKVTDETSVAYKNFLESAYASAQKLGSTMKEIIQATSDFARLGYSIEDATMLAEAANVYMNVGDGIDSVGAASESIISTMKAFNIEAEGSMGIVDRFNEVGNNFAIDSVGIGNALQRSASALAEAGNTIDESIALVTGANTVVQNPEQVGKCFADIKVA